MRTFLIAATVALAPLASLTLADDLKWDGKPGLWETTSTTQMEGMPAMPAMPTIPPEKLAQMPPEARARVEAMMKSRPGGPQTNTSRSCQTRETMSRGMNLNKQPNCTQQVVSSNSSRIQVHVECSPASGAKTSGDMTIDRIDSEHAKGNMTMKINSGDKDMTMNMSFTTRFISADCGDIKPYVPK